MSITPRQSRAARGLLGWTQDDAAVAAGVSIVTVQNFETERTAPQQSTMRVLRKAYEDAGVEILNGDQPGVRLRIGFVDAPKPPRRKPGRLKADDSREGCQRIAGSLTKADATMSRAATMARGGGNTVTT